MERKLTKVQKQVMARFESGDRLLTVETRRASGAVMFWVARRNDGQWYIQEKALYPQLRRLFWYGLITSEHFIQVGDLDLEHDGNMNWLTSEGCIF